MFKIPTSLHLISIHALRGEGDSVDAPKWRQFIAISIHALRGEGDDGVTIRDSIGRISIHALRGEGDTSEMLITAVQLPISIHALRGEGDRHCRKKRRNFSHFNPRPPWGGRPARR